MKKNYAKLILTAVMLMACVMASAFDFQVDGLYYNELNNNTCEVTCYTRAEYTGAVSIPDSVEYNGVYYTVTGIGNNAFERCYGLTSITIPSSVTSIGDDAFLYCDSLTSITIPSSVTSIGDRAFAFCEALTSITIPRSVTSIGEDAFFYCDALTSVTIPNSVTSIGKDAFNDCECLAYINVDKDNTVYDSRENSNALIETASNTLITGCKNTVIPSSVTSIGESAFENCIGLTSITIPSSVTSIGDWAFCYCDALTSITIPCSVTSIGERAFYHCYSLANINVDKDNTVYDSRENCNALIETASNTLITGCKNTVIPSSVTSIGDWAFCYCDSLTSVTIPSGVTSIGESAFKDCEGLTSITIPSGVTSIGDWAFACCDALTSIIIPSSVTSIGVCAFYGCYALTDVTNLAKVPQTLYSNIFYSIAKGATLHVLPGCKAAYEAADYWKDFTIVEDAVDPTGIEGIELGNVEQEKSVVYDLSGRRLSAISHKGLYIKNGKKYILSK